MLPDLDDVTDFGVVQEALHVEDEHGRERVDQHLLLRVEERAGAGRDRDLHRLWLRDVADRVAEGEHVFGLDVELERSPVLDRDRVALVRRVQCRSELPAEDARNRRIRRLGLRR